MAGIRDLEILLATLEPILQEGELVVCTFPAGAYGDGAELRPLAAVQEEEGLTLVLPREEAEAAGLACEGVFRRITLGVHSSLEAVGLTAAVAARLAARGLPANLFAGYFHDHLLVPADRAEEALAALAELAASRPG